MSQPKETLIQGAHILSPVLLPNGFHFVFREEGRGSGGEFAWGEFVRGDRRLELRFRHSLGLVRYHVGDQSASHESYMRELQVLRQCRYPGFSGDSATEFHDLAHDLVFAEDFLSGSAMALQRAAAKETLDAAKRDQQLMAGYVGDVNKLEELHSRFKQGKYTDVLALANDLNYPDRMTESERRMVEIARQKASG